VFVVVIVSAPASAGIETFGLICGDIIPGVMAGDGAGTGCTPELLDRRKAAPFLADRDGIRFSLLNATRYQSSLVLRPSAANRGLMVLPCRAFRLCRRPWSGETLTT